MKARPLLFGGDKDSIMLSIWEPIDKDPIDSLAACSLVEVKEGAGHTVLRLAFGNRKRTL